MTHSLDDLLDAMASPDPAVRDGCAYAELADGITNGRFAGDHHRILSTATQRLDHPDPWARSFAPLMMTWLAAAGTFTRSSFDAFASWYPNEADTRGFDEVVGWIHPVAHGADYLGVVAHRRLVPANEVLSLFAQRMLGPGPAWIDQEDARITRSVLTALADCRAAEATDWLASVTSRLDRFEADCAAGDVPARPPSWIHNTTLTCAKLHLALEVAGDSAGVDTQVARALRERLARIVVRVEPFISG